MNETIKFLNTKQVAEAADSERHYDESRFSFGESRQKFQGERTGVHRME